MDMVKCLMMLDSCCDKLAEYLSTSTGYVNHWTLFFPHSLTLSHLNVKREKLNWAATGLPSASNRKASTSASKNAYM